MFVRTNYILSKSKPGIDV